MTDEKRPEQSSNQQNPLQKDQPAHVQDQKQGSQQADQQGRKPGQAGQDVDTEKNKKTA